MINLLFIGSARYRHCTASRLLWILGAHLEVGPSYAQSSSCGTGRVRYESGDWCVERGRCLCYLRALKQRHGQHGVFGDGGAIGRVRRRCVRGKMEIQPGTLAACVQ
jgi:hypothetical protein